MLYIVATPIGNLKDMTYRAVEVLKSVKVILCEDTAHSKTLLNHYGIETQTRSYHKFSEREKLDSILQELTSGADIALISDAGMPGISDPGYLLIREAAKQGIPYTVVSGACAAINAVVLSGMCPDGFHFAGFLPSGGKQRLEALGAVDTLNVPCVFYCAPHDLDSALSDIYKVFGDRKYAAVREISKMFEQVVYGTLSEGYMGERRGEFVLVVDKCIDNKLNDLSPEEHLRHYLQSGMPSGDAIKRTASDRGVQKDVIYKLYINRFKI